MFRKSFLSWLFVSLICLGCQPFQDRQIIPTPSYAVGEIETAISEPIKAEPLAPPKVESAEPIKFFCQEIDPLPFEMLTLIKKRILWFKKDGEKWWIDWDAERKPLKRIIIHHSAGPKDQKAEILEETNRLIYAKRYNSSADDPGGNDPYVMGQPLHSGHLIKKEGKAEARETFIAYHHLVYWDGRVTTELQPLKKVDDEWQIDMVGWHVGKWPINCDSIAICLVGDFSIDGPPATQLQATSGLIAYYRQLVPDLVIECHKDYSVTECPGDTWDQWKVALGAE